MSDKTWQELGWHLASWWPPEFKRSGTSVVVLAIAETDDGAYQITPACKKLHGIKEWREIRFDHNGTGRKLDVRLWREMPEFPQFPLPPLLGVLEQSKEQPQ